MKFRMFTDMDGVKLAVNVDRVVSIVDEVDAGTTIYTDKPECDGGVILVQEDFDTVFSRLNTVADFSGRCCHG